MDEEPSAVNRGAVRENKYSDGTPARRGNVVLADDDGTYVVVDPAYSDGFMLLAHIENPTHFTRKARVEKCQKQTPGAVERKHVAEVLARVGADRPADVDHVSPTCEEGPLLETTRGSSPQPVTRNVYILGIDHEIQTFDGRRAAEDKSEFEKLLRALVSERHIEFIGDETYPEKNAIAKSVASSLNIRWEPIEMSLAAREALGIADEQLRERHEPMFSGGIPIGSKLVRVLSDGIREEYMLWRTLTKADEAKNILVLSGFSHVDGLRQRFERAGHHVTADSLCGCEWYVNPECK